ncbi:transcription elongation factor SPT6-like isoform X1 [Rhopilema esculentum]|uniref:transcription elongation factor SPT6-like isoform X1 n=1 Tax=Rhopilema esculentum TaxID=499914 RepID=UPI0031E272BD
MSDFLEHEAEESDEELEANSDEEDLGPSEKKKKRKKIEDEEEDDEEDEIDEELINDIINDDDEEVEESDQEPRRKKRPRRESEDEVDDEDLALIEENTGIKLKKKKHSRVKLLDSDEEDEPDETKEREEIENELFKDDEELNGRSSDENGRSSDENGRSSDEREDESAAGNQGSSQAYAPIEDLTDEEDDDGDYGFIVDDDDQPIHTRPAKKKRSKDKYISSALQEAQDIFGLEFDLNELDQYDDGLDQASEEDYEENEDEVQTVKKRKKKKTSRKSIYDVYEPSELEKSHLTDKDNEVRVRDIPERFQLRAVPVKLATDIELDDEAEWIYKQAFMQTPISQQNFPESRDFERRHPAPQLKPVSTIPKIRSALNFMKKELFEVPFIATYRKEYIEPELKVDDLWTIFDFDAKWTQLNGRKQNMKKLFEQMQKYQFELVLKNEDKKVDEHFRTLEQEDIDALDNVQGMEELMDVYMQFQLYYSDDIPKMQAWFKDKERAAKKSKSKVKEKTKKKESSDGVGEGEDREGEDDNTKDGLDESTEKEGDEAEEDEATKEDEDANEDVEETRKIPRRRDFYTICKDNGLLNLTKKFGLSPLQFAENLRDNYQRHEPEQVPEEPEELAEQYICNGFQTAAAVLEGARHMLAVQIARTPLVRQSVRQAFFDRAKVSLIPTKKGKKEIDDFHQYAAFKYIKHKPVRDLQGEQFLKMCQAEKEGLVEVKVGIDLDAELGYTTYLEEIKMLFYRDEYSRVVQEWNKHRTKVLVKALEQILYPAFANELKSKLLRESTDYVIQLCARKLKSLIAVAPYQGDSHVRQESDFGGRTETEHGCRVLACGFMPDQNVAAFIAMLDGDGEVIDFLRLKHLLKRRNVGRQADREAKEREFETVKKFILNHRPHVVAVTAQCREAQNVVEDIRSCIVDLEQEQQMAPIYVELVDGEVAKIYEASPRSTTEFKDYPPLLRHAVSIGRRLQDPLIEFAGLCDGEGELECLILHPLQELLPKEQLAKALEVEFINRTNVVGVDVNRAIEHPHVAALIQFICGLGPRKGGDLIKKLKTQTTRLENRSQLVLTYGMGPQVFLNCAGFIKIDTSSIGDNMEVLDSTRIHPETYDWARKMAVDALEYDDGMEEAQPSAAVEEILEQPDRLKDLDLDAFADELARQGYGNKQITLYDIRDELINRFKDHRVPYRQLDPDEKFKLLTGETEETLFVGKMVTCIVTGFAYRKPSREALDQANPVRNDDTNLWQCPFCLKDNFPDLSEVWTHFDNGSCAGEAVGVRVRLDNGISGFISNRNISDKGVKRPEDRVQHGMTLHARVLKLNMERFQVDLSCKSSDLADKEKKFSPPKDLYYDHDAADKDKKVEEDAKKALMKRTAYIKRVISHPAFKNFTFRDAEKFLEDLEQGECVFRPSSKGSDHLTVTWKVHTAIYQHVDIREEGKENVFSLGKSLWIENEEYEDLDEIIARYIQPMSSQAREIINHRYYRETEGGVKQKLEEILVTEKRKNPSRIPYFFSASQTYPGKFMLGYMPRNKPRVEYVTVCPEGFRYRGRVHGNTNALLRWFKEHFRDPIPGLTPKLTRTPGGGSTNATPYTPGGTPHSILTDIDMSRLTPLSMQGYSRGTPAHSANPAVAILQQDQARSSPGQNYGNQQWNSYRQNQQFPDQYNRYGNYSSRQNTPQQQQQQDQQQYVR